MSRTRYMLVPMAILGIFVPLALGQAAEPKPLPRLRVSDNHRFLVTEDGKTFFYLADTAWELFHRLNQEEAEKYLADRAAKGFNVIQVVVLAEQAGLSEPNAYGHLPLVDKTDPTRPATIHQENQPWATIGCCCSIMRTVRQRRAVCLRVVAPPSKEVGSRRGVK